MPCLNSCSHHLSGSSSKPREKAVLHAQTCHVLANASPSNEKNVVNHSQQSIAHHFTIRMAVPDTVELSEKPPVSALPSAVPGAHFDKVHFACVRLCVPATGRDVVILLSQELLTYNQSLEVRAVLKKV